MFAIESENIVGYQKITIPTGYSLFSVTFQDVGSGDYDIQDIVPYQNGVVVTANARVNIQKMDTDGYYLQSYGFRNGKGGWCSGLTYVGRDAVTFKDGEAMCINNTTGAEVQLQVSGAVALTPWSGVIPTGFSLIGNMTPSTIDIQDIVPYDLDGNVITANARVNIQKMDTAGYYLQSYGYRNGKGGWCSGLTYIGTGAVTFAPGEAACINNTTGAPIKLKYKSPVLAN